MKPAQFSFLILSAATLLFLPAPAFAQQPQPTSAADKSKDADQLNQRGNEAFDAGDFERARQLYAEAFALRKSYDIAGNLGLVELKLGKNAAAAQHFAYSLSIFPPSGKPEARARQEELLRQARASAASLKISLEPKDAALFIDNEPVDSLGLGEVFVEPGKHLVEARKGGLENASQSITAEAGASLDIALSLKPKGPDDLPPPPDPKPIWPTVLLGTIGGAALVSGIGLTIGAAVEHGSAEDAATDCAPFSPSCYTEAQDSLDQSALLQNVGFAMFGVGAAALVGMGIYLAIPSEEPSTGLRIVPSVGADHAYGTVQGVF